MGRVREVTRKALLLYAMTALLIAAGAVRDSFAIPFGAMATIAASVGETEAEPSLYKDATFLLPVGTKVSARWVLPPVGTDKYDAIFSVGASGNPIIGYKSGDMTYLIDPMKEYIVALATAEGVSAITHLSNGVMLLAVGRDIGILAQSSEKTSDKKRVPIAGFQPIASLPVAKIDVLSGAGNEAYAAGYNPRTNRYALYHIRVTDGAGLMDIELVYESDEAITAVAASEEAIFVAAGNSVVRVSREDGSRTLQYTHPSATVTDLALTPAGLIASTSKELLVLGDGGALEIMRSSGHRIFMSGDTLYVLFKTSMGVLAIDNLADLKRFNLAVRPAEAGEVQPALSVSDVRFFESAPPPYAERNFADSFNRDSVRTIVAQIDYSRVSDSENGAPHTVTVSWYEPTGNLLKSVSYQVASQSGAGQLLASIGGEPDMKYRPPQHLDSKGGTAYMFGDDALGLHYPGRYRMMVQVDGVPAGDWFFTLTGEAKPADVIVYNDMATLQSMLDQGLSPRWKSEGGTPLLIVAVLYGSTESVELLLKKGADPNETDKEGNPPLDQCLWGPDSMSKAELLVKHGANVNANSKSGEPLFFNNDFMPSFAAFLIDHGANIYAQDKLKRTVVEVIADSTTLCTDYVITALLKRGADLNNVSTQFFHYNFLGQAIWFADYDCVELLLSKGVSTAVVQREKDRPERSALYVALSELSDNAKSDKVKEHPEDLTASRKIVRLLLSKGATLRPGKKKVTSSYFGTGDYSNLYSDTMGGEGRIMFRGESLSFFSNSDIAKVLDQDDGALEEASKSNDPAILDMALRAHAGRIREIAAAASSNTDLSYADDHCKAALKIAEARYKPIQVDVLPEAQGAPPKTILGIKVVKRDEGGAYVQGVVPGGPGERAGLKAGDIILALDTQKMKDSDEVVSAAARLTPGMPVRVTFLRDDPMLMPDLQLSCGLLEKELDKNSLAEMNLSRWLEANSGAKNARDIRGMLKEIADNEKKKAKGWGIKDMKFR